MRSLHAARRSQQRGIPPLVDQWLTQFGEEQYDGHGGVIRYFSRRSIRCLERSVGRAPLARLASYLDCYKVESCDDGHTVTIGHRFKRIHRR